MVRHSFAPLVVLVTALYILQAQCTPVVIQKRGICATEDPDPSFLSALDQVQVDETRPDAAGSEARRGPIEIETWFHIVTSRAEAGQVTNAMINSQVGFSISPTQQFRVNRPPRSPFCKTRTRMLPFTIDCKVLLDTSTIFGLVTTTRSP